MARLLQFPTEVHSSVILRGRSLGAAQARRHKAELEAKFDEMVKEIDPSLTRRAVVPTRNDR